MKLRKTRSGLACQVLALSVLSISPAAAWDPWGDVTHPGRILDNVQRETNQAVKTVGDAVSKAAPIIATISCPGCAILTSALPADQKKIVETIVTSGMVISTLGPEAGTYYLTVLSAPSGDVHKDEVPVPVVTAPPAGNRYSVDFSDSACIIQLQDGKVQVYGKTKPSFWDAPIKGGDIITAKAKPCPDYNGLKGVNTITSITFKVIGATVNQLQPDDGKYPRYLLIGEPA